ncbi:MAG: hypothetical protein MUE46_04150 [Xanthomonadales bacterium]|nr:hypothetical protein [Xanthomonadales bacterium]
MRLLPRLFFLLLVALLLTACGSQSRKQGELDETLNAYRQAVRWGNLVQMEDFLSESARENHALEALERERFAQVRCTRYVEVSAPIENDDGSVTQTVEIEYTNIHTQTPKRVVDRQTWIWKERRWQLDSGLPRLARDD